LKNIFFSASCGFDLNPRTLSAPVFFPLPFPPAFIDLEPQVLILSGPSPLVSQGRSRGHSLAPTFLFITWILGVLVGDLPPFLFSRAQTLVVGLTLPPWVLFSSVRPV